MFKVFKSPKNVNNFLKWYLDVSQPTLIHEKHLKAVRCLFSFNCSDSIRHVHFLQGPLFSISANQNKSTLFSFGGNVVVIWDVAEVAQITESFHLSQVQS
jgi:hypothetical protein